MADFQIVFSDFASTEVTFLCLTEAAKKRFYGGISVNVVKSAVPAFSMQLQLEGFKVI